MLKEKFTQNFKSQSKDLYEAIKLLFPQNKTEIYIFLGFLLFYFSFAQYIALNSSILDWEYMWVDRYFSFDNPTVYHTGRLNMGGHPLLFIFTYPVLIIGDFLNAIFSTIKIKTILFAITSCYLVSSSIVYIYRYLKNIIEINGYILYLLTILYGFFFTNLVLSFTIESFTYSTFFLSFSVYYYSYKIKKGEVPLFITNLAISTVLGGITLTNAIKGMLPMLFTKESLKKTILKSIGICTVFLVILIGVELKYHVIEIITSRFQNFSVAPDPEQDKHFYRYVIDLFLGSSILFSNIEVVRGTMEHLMNHLLITLDFYKEVWQFIFIGVLYTFVGISIIINRRNKLVQMISLLLSVDILIHIILKFGINDALIFGGHWVYTIPLLLGWLYNSTKEKYRLAYSSILSIMTIILIINNLKALYQFINISIEIFPLN